MQLLGFKLSASVLLVMGLPVINKGPPGVTFQCHRLFSAKLGDLEPDLQVRIEPERSRSEVCGPRVTQSARLLLLVGATIPTLPQVIYCQCWGTEAARLPLAVQWHHDWRTLRIFVVFGASRGPGPPCDTRAASGTRRCPGGVVLPTLPVSARIRRHGCGPSICRCLLAASSCAPLSPACSPLSALSPGLGIRTLARGCRSRKWQTHWCIMSLKILTSACCAHWCLRLLSPYVFELHSISCVIRSPRPPANIIRRPGCRDGLRQR
jgi:hypothetical protein